MLQCIYAACACSFRHVCKLMLETFAHYISAPAANCHTAANKEREELLTKLRLRGDIVSWAVCRHAHERAHASLITIWFSHINRHQAQRKRLTGAPLGIPSRCCSFVKPLKVAITASAIICLLPGVNWGTSPNSRSAAQKRQIVISVWLVFSVTNIYVFIDLNCGILKKCC